MPSILVKKLSVKQMKVKQRPEKGGPAIHVGRLVGTCSGDTRSVQTAFGVTVEFKGMFAGISLIPDPETGEIIEYKVRSDKLFVPSVFEAVLLNAIGPDKKTVEFAADVFIDYREVAGNAGFEYSVQPLFEEKADSNPLAKLMSTLPPMPKAGGKKQLELVTETPADEPADEPADDDADDPEEMTAAEAEAEKLIDETAAQLAQQSEATAADTRPRVPHVKARRR
jgi:hypothetical protein